MSERSIPPSRELILADHAELLSYGVAHIDACQRLGVTVDQIDTWKRSEKTVARRRVVA